jgi:transcription elongation factor Elf1
MSNHHRPREGDLPRAELMRQAQEVRQRTGADIYFKFTCLHCGERCTLADANTLHARGECHACGKETTIRKGGYMVSIIMR